MSSRPSKGGAGQRPAPDLPTRALATCRRAFLAVGAFSAVVNVLMLTGSLYMLQVYDRVLPSRSLPTLVALSIIVMVLYAVQGLFDWLRQRILGRIAVVLDQALSGPVVAAILRGPLRRREEASGLQLSRDLDTVRSFLSGLGPTTLFDLPWMPLYVFACFLLHPYLGWTLVGGALVLVSLTLITEWRTRKPVRAAAQSGADRAVVLEAARRNAEVVAALGMEQRVVRRFEDKGADYLEAQQRAADIAGGLGALSKVLRFMLQSAMLGMGAFLVISGAASPGVMIASSVIASRALAPIELAISSWRPFLSARQSWQRLRNALAEPDAARPVAPERAHSKLTLEQVAVAAPGTTTPIVQGVSFVLEAGQAVGVIGPSASGKSTLARALVGVWPTLRGELRLDGATLDQWPAEVRGAMTGYLPQDVELFDGTVAENIARFDPDAAEAGILAAAKAAGAYDMILRLPEGFNTRIGEGGCALSGGQRQRLGLARALYGDPFLVVLDEPNANLDAEGEAALTEAIKGVRARGGICVVIAHRPSAIAAADMVLAMAQGQVQAFGPKDEVLRKSLAQRDAKAAPAAAPNPPPAPKPMPAAAAAPGPVTVKPRVVVNRGQEGR
ncbi:type I secretion system permease/ATPase [Xanthobacter sp. AM11]|uniref:type I secretion system permease/ATPase n=1 Tax=Xanthobacter sp. AM11 TaxID=3380643 RepID=UPI0039BFC0E4